MKKLAITLIACLACFQSAQAATSALTESLLEYEAITNFIGEPGFTTIGPNEFIVDIKRITRHIDILGIVQYEILTRLVTNETDDIATAAVDVEARHSHSHSDRRGRHHHHRTTNTYVATLTIVANPGIGPNIVTVDSITKVRCQTNTFFDGQIHNQVEVSN